MATATTSRSRHRNLVPAFLSAREVAARWGVSQSAVYHLVELQRIPVLRISGAIRFPIAEIERFERDNLSEASAE